MEHSKPQQRRGDDFGNNEGQGTDTPPGAVRSYRPPRFDDSEDQESLEGEVGAGGRGLWGCGEGRYDGKGASLESTFPLQQAASECNPSMASLLLEIYKNTIFLFRYLYKCTDLCSERVKGGERVG